MSAIARSPYKFHALRVMTDTYGPVNHPQPGHQLPPSCAWRDGTPTQRQLASTSGLGVSGPASLHRALKLIGHYGGQHVVLIGSDAAHRGADDGELVMKPATVLAAWSRRESGLGRWSTYGRGHFFPNTDHADHEGPAGAGRAQRPHTRPPTHPPRHARPAPTRCGSGPAGQS